MNFMVEEQGTVVDIKYSAEGREVVVEVLQTSACGSCKARQGCGQAVMSELGGANNQEKKNHFKIPCEKPIALGDNVLLGMDADAISKVAMLVYLFPLFMSFIGIWLGIVFGGSEAIQILLMVVGFSSAVFVLSRMNIKRTGVLVPKILKVYSVSKDNSIIASTSET